VVVCVCGASLNTMETHSHSTELANPLETQALEEKREREFEMCMPHGNERP